MAEKQNHNSSAKAIPPVSTPSSSPAVPNSPSPSPPLPPPPPPSPPPTPPPKAAPQPTSPSPPPPSPPPIPAKPIPAPILSPPPQPPPPGGSSPSHSLAPLPSPSPPPPPAKVPTSSSSSSTSSIHSTPAPLGKPPKKSPNPILPLAKPPAKSLTYRSPSDSQPSPPAPNSSPRSQVPMSLAPVSLPSSRNHSSPSAHSSNSSTDRTPPLTSNHTDTPPTKSTSSDANERVNMASGDGSGIKTGTGVGIGVVVGFLTLSLVILAVWFTRRRKGRGAGTAGGYIVPAAYASSPNSGNSKSWFTYEELAKATDEFSAHNLLGEGGFGCVYKGFILDGTAVAVKQLKINGGQGDREFRAEVDIITRVHHRHLVSLVGYCICDNQRLLVYEYVPNNNLHYHLHGEGRPVMEWATRVKVAAGAARGIAYLHEDCHPRIIHRDIKSSNILLDSNFEARVADFGLAKLAVDTNTHVSTRVMGTFGYMAPEYASSGKLTEKSDVFSFGVVLLELITGRKPVDSSQPLGEESLVEWARPLLAEAVESGRFEELVDPKLDKNYAGADMFRLIEAAAACIRHLAAKRPRMSQVVRALDTIGELGDLTNGMKPGQSQILNSREQSAEIRIFRRMAFGSQEYSSELFEHSGGWRSVEGSNHGVHL